jgi:hypothetical protein
MIATISIVEAAVVTVNMTSELTLFGRTRHGAEMSQLELERLEGFQTCKRRRNILWLRLS